jgi:23S rRNA-/tRNA-specific pseudouridylate synthase
LRKEAHSPEQTAETHFQVLGQLDRNLSWLEARPQTGRYHQVRRHLLHEGHPIVGDYRYLPFDECEARGQELAIGTRMLLQAKSLTFLHPISREPLTITAPTDPLIARLAQLNPAP